MNSLERITRYQNIHQQLSNQLKHSKRFNRKPKTIQLDHYHHYFHSKQEQEQEQEHQEHQLIISAIDNLYQITNAGKLIIGCNDLIQLIVEICSSSIEHLQGTLPLLIENQLLIINQPTPYLRLPIAPHSQIIQHSTSLLTQIIKFSSPQLSTQQVKLIIHLFINRIGLITSFEAHLKIVLDYIDCLITFGYVPTSPILTSSQQQLDGSTLLIDLVRFVAKIVGLQSLQGTVSIIRALEPKQHSDLIDLSSSDLTIPLQLVVESTAPLDPAIIQQAKACMKDLIRSPANQAIKSLLSTLTTDDPRIDECSKIGAIRCLRYAFEDYDQIYKQVRPAATSSIEEEASGVATSLTLLGLGLLLVKDPLDHIISSPLRTSSAIDHEILMLIYDRLYFRLQPNKTSIIANLMKEDDLDCCLDLLLLFSKERLKHWINDSDWSLDFDLDPSILTSPQEQIKDTEGTKQSPLVPFRNIFSLLFIRHATEIRDAADNSPDKLSELMSWNLITIDKYYSLSITLSRYLSNPLKLSLIDQIQSDQVCSPEYPSWLSNLVLLLDGFFEFDLDRTTLSNNKSVARPSFPSIPSSPADSQVRLLRLIHDIFMEIRDLEDWREELLQEVVIPTLSRFLLLPDLRSCDNPVLIDLVMDLIREVTHNELVNELLSNQDQVVGEQERHQDLTGKSLDTYDRLRKLLMTTAKMGQLIDIDDITQLTKLTRGTQQSDLEPIPSVQNEGTSNLSIPNTPFSTPSSLPLKASTTTSTTISNTIFSPHRLSSSNNNEPRRCDPIFAKRQHDLSYKAVVTLIRMLTDSLKISTGYSNAKCVSIFVDLIGLLRPANGLVNSTNPHSHATQSGLPHSFSLGDLDHDLQRKADESQIDNRARLAILKCLLRLRADEEHRIQFVRDLEIEGLAQIVGRVFDPSRSDASALPSPDKKPCTSPAASSSQKPRTNPIFLRENYEPGGTNMGKRSASVTTSATAVIGTTETLDEGKPLWTVPDNLDEFGWEPKIETQSTHCLVTYDHIVRKDWDPSQDHLSLKNSPSTCHHVVRHMTILPIPDYLAVLIAILRYEVDWELVSYVLCHLPGQLSNKHFTCEPRTSQQIHQLRRFLCSGIKTDTLLHQVRFPPRQRVKLTDAHAISYQTLSTLIAYKALFDKSQADEMIGAFVKGLSKYKDTAKACIHALSLACHELQPSITKFLPEILRGLTKIVSSAFVSVHILELLGFLGQIPSLYANLTEEEFKMIFGISLQYITTHNQLQQLEESRSTHTSANHHTPPRAVGISTSEISLTEDVELAFQQYVYLMAFYIIALWFVSLKLPERKKYVTFITRKLVQACEGKQGLDEPTEVCFDMLNRYTYSNAEPKPRMKQSKFNQIINSSLGKSVRTTSWIIGNSILTIKCLSRPGWTEVCVKRPSGMVKMIWELENLSGDYGASEQDVLEMVIRHRNTLNSAASEDDDMGDQTPDSRQQKTEKSHEDRLVGSSTLKPREVSLESVIEQSEEITRTTGIEPNYTNLSVEPSFFALQLFPFGDLGSATLEDSPSTFRPLKVPDQPIFQRAVEMIDYLPVVDFHKIGVVYVGPGQTTEEEILGNREGSKAYINFLSSLGQLVRLKGCEHYNTGGLDSKNDSNGKFAYMWGDDITQICFHIATLMPTSREEQPSGPDPIMAKKALIGNDFVVIVFNDSGKEYQFDCLKSQFNFINIIIEPNTPINSTLNLHAGVQQELKFFKISLQRKRGLPKIGPIAENFKMISSSCLSEFVRRLSLHCNTFSQIYLACVGTENRKKREDEQDDEHHSNSHHHQLHPNRRKLEFVSNWRARLREIKRLKDRILKLVPSTPSNPSATLTAVTPGPTPSSDDAGFKLPLMHPSASATPTAGPLPPPTTATASSTAPSLLMSGFKSSRRTDELDSTNLSRNLPNFGPPPPPVPDPFPPPPGLVGTTHSSITSTPATTNIPLPISTSSTLPITLGSSSSSTTTIPSSTVPVSNSTSTSNNPIGNSNSTARRLSSFLFDVDIISKNLDFSSWTD